MKKTITLFAMAALFGGFVPAAPLLAAGNPLAGLFGIGFTDLDGDGINDNAPDADGDGIPNSQDPDYVRPQDGSGSKFGAGTGTGTGVCDGTGPQGAAKGRR